MAPLYGKTEPPDNRRLCRTKLLVNEVRKQKKLTTKTQ